MVLKRTSIKNELASILRVQPEALRDEDVNYVLSLEEVALREHLSCFASGMYTNEEIGDLDNMIQQFVVRTMAASESSSSSEDEEDDDEDSGGTDDTGVDERTSCGCEGLTHKSRVNCSQCGRIHCTEEASSYCLFCRCDLREKSMLKKIEDEVEFMKAVNRTKRLLQFQAESAMRTQVIDENVDWFEEGSNLWLSQETRAYANKMATKEKQDTEALSKRACITIDLATRKVIDNRVEMEAKLREEQALAFASFQDQKNEPTVALGSQDAGRAQDHSDLYDSLMTRIKKLDTSMLMAKMNNTGDQIKNEKNSATLKLIKEAQYAGAHHQAGVDRRFHEPCLEIENALMRVDDETDKAYEDEVDDDSKQALKFSLPPELKHLPDKGHVLTLHQPWATLIIEGYKRCEGRGWSTDYRGPLWIHAASKPMEMEDYLAAKQKYLDFYASLGTLPPSFPSPHHFPESALLGRVVLCDVVENNDHDLTEAIFASRKEDWWPALEDNSSQYLFICANPERLLVPITVSGRHKIWKLKPSDAQAYSEVLNQVKWPYAG